MESYLRTRTFLCSLFFLAFGAVFGNASTATAQINVITVDCTPFVSPGPSSFGPTNTMGTALQAVDLGSDFNVTEVTSAAFQALTAEQLASFDLIAVNNNPSRLGDNCVAGVGNGLGITWHSVVGIQSGGRVVLSSHDAPRFKLLRTPPDQPLFTGFEPFGTVGFVRQAALWTGGVPGQTGLLIFNDAARFTPGFGSPIGGQGWDNPELNLPTAWGITDLDQSGGNFMDGGYTDILPAFQTHPIYDGTAIGGVILSDVRGAQFTLSSFSANIGDTSFHSVFDSFDPLIFTPTEVVVNAMIVNVDGLCPFCASNAALGPDGKAITLIRDAAPVTALDHYKCYAVETKGHSHRSRGHTHGFRGRDVLLEDQFETKETRVKEERLLCNPVSKDGVPIVNPTAHLVCYAIHDLSGQRHFARRKVLTADQFGELKLRVMMPRMLCVPATKEDLGIVRHDRPKKR